MLHVIDFVILLFSSFFWITDIFLYADIAFVSCQVTAWVLSLCCSCTFVRICTQHSLPLPRDDDTIHADVWWRFGRKT